MRLVLQRASRFVPVWACDRKASTSGKKEANPNDADGTAHDRGLLVRVVSGVRQGDSHVSCLRFTKHGRLRSLRCVHGLLSGSECGEWMRLGRLLHRRFDVIECIAHTFAVS